MAGKFVVTKDKKVEYRTVQLGPLVNGLRVVRSGVADGGLVIVNGLQRVRPGAVVEPKVVPMDQPAEAGVAGAAAAPEGK